MDWLQMWIAFDYFGALDANTQQAAVQDIKLLKPKTIIPLKT